MKTKEIKRIEVFKVKGNSLKEAFNNLKIEQNLEDYYVTPIPEKYLPKSFTSGEILKKSKQLLNKYIKGSISEHEIMATLYNNKPLIADESKIIMHNIVIKGTKRWETINAYTTDGDLVVASDTDTKADALEKAKELAIEHNTSINIVVSKRLVDIDGIIGIAEFVPFTNIEDDSNVYIFWLYNVTREDMTDDEAFEENVEVAENNQLVLKEDFLAYHTTKYFDKHEGK